MNFGVIAPLSVCLLTLTHGAHAGVVVTVDDSGGADYLTIQAAIDDASASEFTEIQVFTGFYTSTGSSVIDTQGKPVSIHARWGFGTVVVDGQNVRRVVHCNNDEDNNTRLIDLVISNGLATQGGGVYISACSPRFINCRFVSNHATNEGGGVFCHTGNPLFDDCQFRINSAGTLGGGFYMYKAGTVINGGDVSYNTTDNGGGGNAGAGIAIEGGFPQISNCTIEQNTPTFANGGGVLIYQKAVVGITDCHFLANTARNGAGLLIMEGSAVTMDGCTAVGNVAEENGGGLYCLDSHLQMDQCMLTDNTADLFGGGMAVANWPGNSVTLTQCTISGNRVTQESSAGGGIYNSHLDEWEGGLCTITIQGCTVTDNHTPNMGGGLYLKYSVAEIIGGSFANNTAKDGGGIYAINAKAHCSGLTCTGNLATMSGGGICQRYPAEGSSAELQYTDGELSGNTAEYGGGAYIYGGTGGASSLAEFEGVTIQNNIASRQGGGFCLQYAVSMSTNCEFSGCAVVNDDDPTNVVGGGAVYESEYSQNDMTSCTMTSNRSEGGGGALYIGGHGTYKACGFYGNTAKEHGGACYVASSGASIFRENCLFESNDSTESGGGIYAEQSSPNVYDCTFLYNQARYGGGFFGNDHVASIIQNCSFAANTASERGGAIGCWNLSNLRVIDCELQSNSAKRGGGAYAQFQSYPVYSGTTFLNNVAWDLGGAAVDIGGSPTTYNECTFEGNQATGENGGQGSGGAVHADGSLVRYLDSTFSGNVAASRGGAMYNWNTAVEVDACSVSGNSATTGGGMYTVAGYEPLVVDSTYCGNSPDQIVGDWADNGGNSVEDECHPCPGDATGDGVVDVNDLLYLLSAWGTDDPNADFDDNGVVDVDDVLILLSHFGESCP